MTPYLAVKKKKRGGGWRQRNDAMPSCEETHNNDVIGVREKMQQRRHSYKIVGKDRTMPQRPCEAQSKDVKKSCRKESNTIVARSYDWRRARTVMSYTRDCGVALRKVAVKQ